MHMGSKITEILTILTLAILLNSLAAYTILCWKFMSLRISKALLHCVLACSISVEKSDVILILQCGLL